jgi:hypothetical protein
MPENGTGLAEGAGSAIRSVRPAEWN